MDIPSRSLDFQQAFQTEPNFDKYARQILENSKTIAAPTAATSTAPIPSRIADFLQEFGATFINSIQLQNFQKNLHTNHSASAADPEAGLNISINADAAADAVAATSDIFINNSTKMEIELVPNHIIFGSNTFQSMDDLQKQLEYDKFMNEVWIGIVLTLILISMIFCICSCFLYHQFRTWKRNYYSTVVQIRASDVESLKIEPDIDDPVPQYTLVSGLPSYEAALELMQKAPPTKSCLIVYPSVFNVFNRNERSTVQQQDQQQQLQQQQQQYGNDITTPLLSSATKCIESNTETTATTIAATTTITSTETMQQQHDPSDSTIVGSAIDEKGLLELLNSQASESASAASNAATKPLENVIIVVNIEKET